MLGLSNFLVRKHKVFKDMYVIRWVDKENWTTSHEVKFHVMKEAEYKQYFGN